MWIDPCNTVIPAAKRTVFDQQQAAMGRSRRWISSDARQYSRNLRAAPYAGKQKQWADKRAWWFVILARGRIILKMMPIDWEQKGPGMAELIQDLPDLLKQKLSACKHLPKVVVTDRGPGVYQTYSGTIAAAYEEALAGHGFVQIAGDEAAWRPPDTPDELLHETVAAWVRAFSKKRPFKLVPKVQENLKRFGKLLEKR